MNNTWSSFYDRDENRLRWFDIRNEENLKNDPLEFFGFELKIDENYYAPIMSLSKRIENDISQAKEKYETYIARYKSVVATADTADDIELVSSEADLGEHTIK